MIGRRRKSAPVWRVRGHQSSSPGVRTLPQSVAILRDTARSRANGSNVRSTRSRSASANRTARTMGPANALMSELAGLGKPSTTHLLTVAVGTLAVMTDQDRNAEMLAQMRQAAEEQQEQQRRYRAYLHSMYGTDQWDRGTVLIFYPNPNEKDQEVRVAVKIGVNQWTTTGRGSSRTWDETLEKIGPGKLLHQVTAKQPVIIIEAEQDAIGQHK